MAGLVILGPGICCGGLCGPLLYFSIQLPRIISGTWADKPQIFTNVTVEGGIVAIGVLVKPFSATCFPHRRIDYGVHIPTVRLLTFLVSAGITSFIISVVVWLILWFISLAKSPDSETIEVVGDYNATLGGDNGLEMNITGN